MVLATTHQNIYHRTDSLRKKSKLYKQFSNENKNRKFWEILVGKIVTKPVGMDRFTCISCYHKKEHFRSSALTHKFLKGGCLARESVGNGEIPESSRFIFNPLRFAPATGIVERTIRFSSIWIWRKSKQAKVRRRKWRLRKFAKSIKKCTKQNFETKKFIRYIWKKILNFYEIFKTIKVRMKLWSRKNFEIYFLFWKFHRNFIEMKKIEMKIDRNWHKFLIVFSSNWISFEWQQH